MHEWSEYLKKRGETASIALISGLIIFTKLNGLALLKVVKFSGFYEGWFG